MYTDVCLYGVMEIVENTKVRYKYQVRLYRGTVLVRYTYPGRYRSLTNLKVVLLYGHIAILPGTIQNPVPVLLIVLQMFTD